MEIIAARKPFYIEADTTNLQVEVKSWAVAEPTEYQHIIKRPSYSGGVESLRINISPFIESYFTMEPQTLPSNISAVATGHFLNVKVRVNGTAVTEYKAVNGYVSPADEAFYDHWQTVKRIHSGTDSVVSLPPTVYAVNWATSDGQTATENTTSTTYPHIARVAHTSLNLSTANWVTVSTPLYTYKYDVVCPYMDGTIGFVNSVGMWEYFDINGRQDYNRTREGEQYMPFSTGELRTTNVNGERKVRINTGWVDQEWGRRIIPELLMSENIVWHKGTTWDWMILDTNSMEEKLQRTTKMMNYTFDLTYAAPNIPVI